MEHIGRVHATPTPHSSAFISDKFVVPSSSQVKQHNVAKVAIYQDERQVEVLDTNGLQRSVQIFPEAVPYLVSDMREADVDFYVAPPLSGQKVNPLVPFLSAFIATMFMLLLLEALGMLGMVLFAWAMIFEQLGTFADDVGVGWAMTLDDVKVALKMKPRDVKADSAASPQGEAIPVLIEDEQSSPQDYAASSQKQDDDPTMG